MKVYELIQELAKYNANTEVNFHVRAKLDIDTEATFNRDNEDDTQNVTIEADIDDDFAFEDITDNEKSMYHPNITINLEY